MTELHGSRYLSTEADRCVKCGLCLPACPTYGISRSESDSPRGRIALIDGLARGQLSDDPALLAHLDSCLLCRSCENRCPSGVHFGQIMDGARALTLAHRSRRERLTADLLSDRRLARLGLGLSHLLPDTLLPAPKGLAKAARHLAARKHTHKHKGKTGGPRVALFRGCVGDAVQHSALDAARDLLASAGAQVLVPAGQACCGAMHGHLGDSARAERLSARNRSAFAVDGLEAVLSLASGCGAQLAEYDPPLSAPHQDVSQYLLDSGLIDKLAFRPLQTRAVVHVPCSQANLLGGGRAVFELLARIPGLQVSELTAGATCCGAGGLQLLTHPEQGEALRAPKIAAIRESQATLLVTSNPGCALHLAAGLGVDGPEVLHPVELLARQLDRG